MQQLLTTLLKESAEKFQKRPALTMQMEYRTVSLSYQETYDLSRKIACFLSENKIQKGDKVVLLAPNSPYWICVFWGAILRGAVIVPLNTQSTPEMIQKVLDSTQTKIIFKTIHHKQDFSNDLKVCEIELIPEYASNFDISNFKENELKENDLAQIMYTSGTTGDPKGVMLTHKNLHSNAISVSKLIPITPKDRLLSILPLSHIFEQTAGFLTPFNQGAHIIYAHSPAAIVSLLKKYRVTKMVAVPEFLEIIMKKIQSKAKEKGKLKTLQSMMRFSHKFSFKPIQRLLFRSVHKTFGKKLKVVASGGAPLDAELEKKWNALGIDLLQGYGLTETSPVISTNTLTNHRFGSVGKIIPGVEVKIGSDSEILVKGPNVFEGYFKNDEKTKEAFTHDGWFKTDDLGELDKDGFLKILGRKKYMILGSGGQNVYPVDIELELNKISGVKDSCVVGLKQKDRGTQIHAVLLFDEKHPDAKTVIEKANQKLASYQQITAWSIWPKQDFDRSQTRKIKKGKVIGWLESKEKMSPKKTERITPLTELLSEITGVKPSEISQQTTMANLNLDSLLRVELVAHIGEKFGVTVEEPKIISSTTTSKLNKMIQAAKPLEEKKFSDLSIQKWAQTVRLLFQTLLFFPLIGIFMKLKTEGRENLEDLSLPVVFMPNHLSFLDSVALPMSLPLKIRKKIAFAAAVEILYKKYWWSSWFVQLMFNSFKFPTKESESAQYGLRYLGRRLDQGQSIVIYPEGRITRTGKLQPLKRGTGLIATTMNVQIVPIKITGTEKILPVGCLFPRRRGDVTVKFGKPVKFSLTDSYIETTEKIQKLIEEL